MQYCTPTLFGSSTRPLRRVKCEYCATAGPHASSVLRMRCELSGRDVIDRGPQI